MDIALYSLRSVACALVNPYYILILIMIAFTFYKENKKTTLMQSMIIGERFNSPFELTISQIVIGIVVGIVGTIIISYLGLIFESTSIYLLFIMSMVLMVWNPRFICFSYSGAILGLISLIIEVSSKSMDVSQFVFLKVDIVTLMSLVGILHIIEGLLVIIDGKTGCIPVFTNRGNRIIGGFAFKRYWPLPLSLFIIMTNSDVTTISQQIQLPNWWPVLANTIPLDILSKAIISLVPFYAIIGYSGVTFTKTKKEKILFSGVSILTYGCIVLLLSQIGALLNVFKYMLIILVPVLHELMLKLQKNIELKGKPRYISDEDGIIILEVAPCSIAKKMGIRSGDTIIEVNDKKIIDEEDIINARKSTGNTLSFKVRRTNGVLKKFTYEKINGIKTLGIVFVPRVVPDESRVVKIKDSSFSDVLKKEKDKNKDKLN